MKQTYPDCASCINYAGPYSTRCNANHEQWPPLCYDSHAAIQPGMEAAESEKLLAEQDRDPDRA